MQQGGPYQPLHVRPCSVRLSPLEPPSPPSSAAAEATKVVVPPRVSPLAAAQVTDSGPTPGEAFGGGGPALAASPLSGSFVEDSLCEGATRRKEGAGCCWSSPRADGERRPSGKGASLHPALARPVSGAPCSSASQESASSSGRLLMPSVKLASLPLKLGRLSLGGTTGASAAPPSGQWNGAVVDSKRMVFQNAEGTTNLLSNASTTAAAGPNASAAASSLGFTRSHSSVEGGGGVGPRFSSCGGTEGRLTWLRNVSPPNADAGAEGPPGQLLHPPQRLSTASLNSRCFFGGSEDRTSNTPSSSAPPPHRHQPQYQYQYPNQYQQQQQQQQQSQSAVSGRGSSATLLPSFKKAAEGAANFAFAASRRAGFGRRASLPREEGSLVENGCRAESLSAEPIAQSENPASSLFPPHQPPAAVQTPPPPSSTTTTTTQTRLAAAAAQSGPRQKGRSKSFAVGDEDPITSAAAAELRRVRFSLDDGSVAARAAAVVAAASAAAAGGSFSGRGKRPPQQGLMLRRMSDGEAVLSRSSLGGASLGVNNAGSVCSVDRRSSAGAAAYRNSSRASSSALGVASSQAVSGLLTLSLEEASGAASGAVNPSDVYSRLEVAPVPEGRKQRLQGSSQPPRPRASAERDEVEVIACLRRLLLGRADQPPVRGRRRECVSPPFAGGLAAGEQRERPPFFLADGGGAGRLRWPFFNEERRRGPWRVATSSFRRRQRRGSFLWRRGG